MADRQERCFGVIRAAAIAATLLLPAASLLAADNVVSTRAGAGMLYGAAREVVYEYPEATGFSMGPRYTLSELIWPMQPVAYAATALEVHAPFGLMGSLEIRSAFPGASGSMTDSDFLNGDGQKTHFSQHECSTDGAILLDARVGWSFPIGSLVSIEPFGSFSLMRWQWSAHNGYLQYPPQAAPPYTTWSPSTPRINVYGTGIVYEQNYYLPAVGVEGVFHLFGRLDAAVSLAGSPFAACVDTDKHLFRQIDFHGTMLRGFLIEPGLEAAYRLTDRARVSLELAYRYVGGLVGDNYLVGTGVAGFPGGELAPGETGQVFTDGGGAAYSALGASVGFELSY